MPLHADKLLAMLTALQNDYNKKNKWIAGKNAPDLEGFVDRARLASKVESDYEDAVLNLESAQQSVALSQGKLSERESKSNTAFLEELAAPTTQKKMLRQKQLEIAEENREAALAFHEQIQSKINENTRKKNAAIRSPNYPQNIIAGLEKAFVGRAIEYFREKHPAFKKISLDEVQTNQAISEFIAILGREPKDHMFYRGIGLILRENYKDNSDYLVYDAIKPTAPKAASGRARTQMFSRDSVAGSGSDRDSMEVIIHAAESEDEKEEVAKQPSTPRKGSGSTST